MKFSVFLVSLYLCEKEFGLRAEFLNQLSDRRSPVSGRGLTEEAHGWIPRRIVAADNPAPVGGVEQQRHQLKLQNRPGRIYFAKCTCLTDTEWTVTPAALVVRPFGLTVWDVKMSSLGRQRAPSTMDVLETVCV